ncbi:MAG TPA: RidA family protein [Gemmatimonadaceae bacterium]
MTDQTLNPEGWPRPSGYANGVVATGRLVVLAGQIGWNPATLQFESDDIVSQTRQALLNVRTLLTEAGATPEDVLRMTWYITNREEYVSARREIGEAYREVIGAIYPAMSVIVISGLVEPRAKVEIEATAVVSGDSE